MMNRDDDREFFFLEAGNKKGKVVHKKKTEKEVCRHTCYFFVFVLFLFLLRSRFFKIKLSLFEKLKEVHEK